MTQINSADPRPDDLAGATPGDTAGNAAGRTRGSPHLVVNEIFGPTIQGEGLSAGVPAVFLRLAGCPLSCSWCDTAYAWDWSRFDRSAEAHPMSAENVWNRVVTLAADSGVSTLVITGGEPASQARALQPLLERARAAGWRSEMETSGSVDPSRILGLLDLVTVSPKTSNSGVPQEHRLRPDVLRTLACDPKAVWKFVVESDSDLDEIDKLVRTYGLAPVLLMAQATTRTESLERTSRLVPLAIARGYRVAPRLHVLLWGDERGR